MKIGLITDIHENATLLASSLRLAQEKKCDEIVCLGDIVGYDRRFYDYSFGRSASECLRLIRSHCKWITLGNHDLFAAARIPSYTNGFTYPADWFNLDHIKRKSISGGKVWCYEGESPNDLTEDDIDFLKSLPEYIITDFDGMKCLFSHYFAPDFTGSSTVYIERKSQLMSHWKVLAENNIPVSFCGHTHNNYTSLAFRDSIFFAKAIQVFHENIFNLGNEVTAAILLPLAGEKGRCSFTVLDTGNQRLEVFTII